VCWRDKPAPTSDREQRVIEFTKRSSANVRDGKYACRTKPALIAKDFVEWYVRNAVLCYLRCGHRGYPAPVTSHHIGLKWISQNSPITYAMNSVIFVDSACTVTSELPISLHHHHIIIIIIITCCLSTVLLRFNSTRILLSNILACLRQFC